MIARAPAMALLALSISSALSAQAANECAQPFTYVLNQICQPLPNGQSLCQPVIVPMPKPSCFMQNASQAAAPAQAPVAALPPIPAVAPQNPYNTYPTAQPYMPYPAYPQMMAPSMPMLPYAPAGNYAQPVFPQMPAMQAPVAQPAAQPVVQTKSAAISPTSAAPAKPAVVVETPKIDVPKPVAAPAQITPQLSASPQVVAPTKPVAPAAPAPKTAAPAAPAPAQMPAPTPSAPAPMTPVVVVPAVETKPAPALPVPKLPVPQLPVIPPPTAAVSITPGTPNKASMMGDIVAYFEFNSDKLTDAAKKQLDAWIEKAPVAMPILITGHADRIGSRRYNLLLSIRRAEAVRKYLVGKGKDSRDISLTAKGELAPVKTCQGVRPVAALKACLGPNRRVSVHPE